MSIFPCVALNCCCVCIPHIGIVALLSETGSYSSALLLHNSSLVGNRLCGAHISNELFDYCINLSALRVTSGDPAYENSCWRSLRPQNGAWSLWQGGGLQDGDYIEGRIEFILGSCNGLAVSINYGYLLMPLL
jgi:hypothetical protein